MWACLSIAAGLGALDAALAATLWKLLSRQVKRAWLARAAATLAGALIGAWLAEPQLELVVDTLGYREEAAGMAVALTYPLSLPVTTGMAAWLFAETIGGRSARPLRAAVLSCAGSIVGAVVVFVPMFFIAGPLQLMSAAVVIGIPAAGSLLALAPTRNRTVHSSDGS
jgi:hypothetical protein